MSELIDRMVQRPDLYSDDLMELVRNVYNFSDYSHFKRLDDGDKKTAVAKEAVEAFRKSCGDFLEQENNQKQAEENKKKFEAQRKNTLDYNKKIDEFKERFYMLVKSENSQKRGYQFEEFLGDLFAFFDLSPRSSFKIQGEQIDGSFTHGNTDYLIEAKWKQEPIDRSDIDIFEAKVSRNSKLL